MAASIQERLNELYRRLGEQPASSTPSEAWQRVVETLTQVEDELSGIPRREPPPPPETDDGRMYPPLADHVTHHADGGIIAITRKHMVEIGRRGSITIINRKTKTVEFSQAEKQVLS